VFLCAERIMIIIFVQSRDEVVLLLPVTFYVTRCISFVIFYVKSLRSFSLSLSLSLFLFLCIGYEESRDSILFRVHIMDTIIKYRFDATCVHVTRPALAT